MAKNPSYTEEFKQEAVKLVVHEGYTIVKASKHLGISTSTMDNWLKRYRDEIESGLSSSDKARLLALEKENRELRMERDILKKAAAFFAKESG